MGYPMRPAMSQTIRQSSRASPGGSTALRTRCTRRSVFVKVPSFSAKQAEGSTTSASRAVSVRKMSCTTRKSRARRLFSAWFRSGSRDHRVLADDVERLDRPGVRRGQHLGHRQAGRGRQAVTPQACSNFGARAGVGHLLVAGEHIGQAAHVAGALHVVLAAQGVHPGSGMPMLPHSMARLASDLTLSVPVVCWVIPMQ